MSYLNSVEKAVLFMEDHLQGDEVNIASVCEHVGISKWYFQRIFRGITGDSIGDYLRRRRLSLAASSLIETDRPIIQIAINHGFESQEAFSRAFKKQFEMTPAKFRKDQIPKTFMHKFQLDKDFLQHLKERVVMEPVIERRNEMKLVGLSTPFRGVFDENPNNMEVIPPLWGKFFERFGEIPQKKAGHLYGVVECKNENGQELLTYRVMVEVEAEANVPEGMESFSFPAGELAKFTHKGSPAGIEKTIKYIFGTWLPSSKRKLREGLELEIYPAGYNPQDPNAQFEYCLLLQ